MRTLVADCETNGLLPELTTIHCIAAQDPSTDEKWSWADQPGYAPIEDGLRFLAEADTLVFHNAIGFDVPALRKIYPWWRPRGVIRDTLVMASLCWPKNPVLMDKDAGLVKSGRLPGNLMGRHSLEAYGYRLGEYKGSYGKGMKDPWAKWTPEMHDYMVQDVNVGTKLWRRCLAELETWPENTAVELEHEVAWVLARQERSGFAFNEGKAIKLLAGLTQRKADMEVKLADVFPPKIVRTVKIPKRSNKTKGWVKDVPVTIETSVPFKPSSRHHVAERLQGLGWKPAEFGADGIPKVDDDILQALPYPQAKVLAELFTIDKRIGQLSTGKQAWLKSVKNGRIHGRVQTMGAVTSRMTHSNPNVAQVPKEKEYRELFVHSLGCLVGCDADGIEARVEAGYTVPFDGGAYMRTILEGKKELGTDVHSINAKALASIVPGISRDTAKTTKYAITYGAGDWKAGASMGVLGPQQKVAAAGKRGKALILGASPGLGKLVAAVTKAAAKGWLKGLDGRKIVVRKAHAAVNTLFQSAGAIVMKRALVILDTDLAGQLPSLTGIGQDYQDGPKFTPGVDFEFAANVHDEWQIDCSKAVAEVVGEAAAEAIRLAGEFYNFRCPQKGNYDIGQSWADTH